MDEKYVKMSDSSESEDDTQAIVDEVNLCLIRNAVNQNKIKLWTAPYYDKENPNNEDGMVELASSLATALEMDVADVLRGLKQLQTNALEKLMARDKLAKSNEIMVKIKVPKMKQNFNVVVDGNSNALALAGEISKKLSVDDSNPTFKLISGGKVLSDEKSLLEQGLRPGATVMALKVESNSRTMALVEEQRRILKTTRSDAEWLCEDNNLEITNQEGNTLEFPREEKNALILAMSLHEKGRAAMRNDDFELALVLLTDAADEYQQCRHEILNTVDNCAVLNLDIAWCYLRLGNVSDLPNASKCLDHCENFFARSYGSNLERLEAIKGSKGEEGALIVRMHLLQAIVSYHSGQTENAKKRFQSVSVELQNLRLPTESVEEVMAAGFTKVEARLALRAMKGDVTKSVRHATKVKQRREQVEEEELERKRKRLKLGKTPKGDWVNLGYLSSLTKMGYDEKTAALALRHTENDLNRAVEVINEHPELLIEKENDDHFDPNEISKEMIDPLVGMGFEENSVRRALIKHKGNADRAIEELTSRSKNPPAVPIISESSSSSQHSEDEEAMAMKKARTDEAIHRFEEILDEAEYEGYLDLDLEEEKTYLEKYLRILKLK